MKLNNILILVLILAVSVIIISSFSNPSFAGDIGSPTQLLKGLPTNLVSIDAGLYTPWGLGTIYDIQLPGLLPLVYLEYRTGSVAVASKYKSSIYVKTPLVGESGGHYRIGAGLRLTQKEINQYFRWVVSTSVSGRTKTENYYWVEGPVLKSTVLMLTLINEPSGSAWEFSSSFGENALIKGDKLYFYPRLRTFKAWNFLYTASSDVWRVKKGDSKRFSGMSYNDIGPLVSSDFKQLGFLWEYFLDRGLISFRIGLGLTFRLDAKDTSLLDKFYIPLYFTLGTGGNIPVLGNDRSYWAKK